MSYPDMTLFFGANSPRNPKIMLFGPKSLKFNPIFKKVFKIAIEVLPLSPFGKGTLLSQETLDQPD